MREPLGGGSMGPGVGKREELRPGAHLTRRDLLALSAFGLVAGAPITSFAATPQGQLTWGVHISLAPTWFDPAETPGPITPFIVLSALPPAMVHPTPTRPPPP